MEGADVSETVPVTVVRASSVGVAVVAVSVATISLGT
jgi:hypothetical protein